MSEQKKIIVGVTGASGSCYALQLLKKINETSIPRGNVTVIFSATGLKVAEYEIGAASIAEIHENYKVYHNDNLTAACASGSSSFDTLIVVPCSMGTLARIASGVSSDLISRTADVMLKERRRLILVTREMPLNSIHLENMLRLTKAGGIVCPASPSFYSKPHDLDTLAATVTERILSLAGITVPGKYEWNDLNV